MDYIYIYALEKDNCAVWLNITLIVRDRLNSSMYCEVRGSHYVLNKNGVKKCNKHCAKKLPKLRGEKLNIGNQHYEVINI